MSLFDSIDNYCERLDPGLWAEPLNAVSNAAFFIAAYFLYKQYRGAPHAALIVSLVALVGVGSTLFHTFATRLTMLADIIPIGIFVFAYLWLSMRHLAGFPVSKAALGLLLFTLAAIAAESIPPAYRLNGSVSYLPCLLALMILSQFVQPGSARLLRLAAAIFALSLTFRSLDMALCPMIPFGVHLLWHLLNGAVLYLLGRALLLKQA